MKNYLKNIKLTIWLVLIFGLLNILVACGDPTATSLPATVPANNETLKLAKIATIESKNHGRWTLTMSVSPDGKYLATGSQDSTVKIWDSSTGALLTTLRGFQTSYGIQKVAFSQDSQMLAAGDSKNTIKIWKFDGTPPKIKSTITIEDAKTEFISDLIFSSDNKNLFYTSGKTIKKLNVEDGKELGRLSQPIATITRLALSSKNILASSDNAGEINLWDLATDKLLTTYKINSKQVDNLAFNPDGTLLAVGIIEGTVQFWNTQTNQKVSNFSFNTISPINNLVFNKDGTRLICDSVEDMFLVEVNQTEAKLLKSWKFHNGSATKIVQAEQPSLVFSSSEDNIIMAWNWEGQLVKQITPEDNLAVKALTPDGQLIAFFDSTKKAIQLAQPANIQNIAKAFPLNDISFVSKIVFSADGKLMAAIVNVNKGKVLIWDVASTKLLSSIETKLGANSVVFSGDNTKLIALGRYSGITTYKIDNAKGLAIWNSDKTSYDADYAFTLNTSGNELIIVDRKKPTVVKAIDVTTGQEKKLFEDPAQKFEIHSTSLSPDGQFLLTLNKEDEVTIWDYKSAKKVSSFSLPNYPSSIKLNSNKTITYLDGQQIIRVVDFATQKEITNSESFQTAGTNQIFINSKGDVLVSVFGDGEALIWQL